MGEDGFSMWNLREEKCSQMGFSLEEAQGRGAGTLLADALSLGLPHLWSEVEALIRLFLALTRSPWEVLMEPLSQEHCRFR